MSGTKRRNTRTISSRLPPKRPTISPALDQFARVRCRCRRARRRSCRDDRAGKAPSAPCRSASPHGRSCPPPGGFAVSEALAVMAGSAARRSARRRGFSGSPRDHRYPGICMSISTASTARSPPAPAERPPARRRRGPPGRPRCSTARRRPGGSARCPPLPADARPATAGCAPPGARRVGRGALFAVQRMQHRVGQLLRRDRLGEENRRRAARCGRAHGRHLAAIGGDRRSPWAAAGRPATGGSVAPR